MALYQWQMRRLEHDLGGLPAARVIEPQPCYELHRTLLLAPCWHGMISCFLVPKFALSACFYGRGERI